MEVCSFVRNSWGRHQKETFPRYWPFVRGIHRPLVNYPHKGQWCGSLMFSLICALNKRLSKQSWGWWFETPSRPLWRHCNVMRSHDDPAQWHGTTYRWISKACIPAHHMICTIRHLWITYTWSLYQKVMSWIFFQTSRWLNMWNSFKCDIINSDRYFRKVLTYLFQILICTIHV